MGGVFALVGLLIIAPSALSMASLAGDRFAWLQSVARCLPDQAVGNVLTAGVDVAVSSSSTNVSVDVEAMNTAAGSAAGASAGSAADAAVASDPSGLFDPTWWQSGLIVLACVAVSSSSTNVSVDVEAMNTAAGSAAGASAGSAADAAVASDPSGLFDPTWWQSGLIVLAWMTVAYIIGVMAVRRSDVK